MDEMTEKKRFYAKMHFDSLYRRKDRLRLYNALDLCLTAQSSYAEGFEVGSKIKMKKDRNAKPQWFSVTKDKEKLLEIANNQMLLLSGRNGVKYCGYYFRTIGFKDTSLKPLSGINKFMLFPKEYN